MAATRGAILTIDVGTSSVKAALYDTAGRVVAAHSRRYDFQSPQPGWAEADPEEWWAATQRVLSDLREKCSLEDVIALSFTGQMHTGVLLDAAGEVIPPTILWLDRRADGELAELQELLHRPPYELNSTYTLPKLLWLKRHHPDALEKVDTILWPKDYLRYRFTGVKCSELTEAGGAALLDWSTREWAIDRLNLVGLPAAVLPEMRPADGDGGALLPHVADALGLNPDAKVIVGMGDVAALFGGAPLRAGRVVCSLGSSSMVFAPLAEGQDATDPQHRIHEYPFGPTPMLGGVSSTSGAALLWAYENISQGPARGQSFEDFVSETLEISPGAEGLTFAPYLAGERSPHWNDAIRGGFYGLQLSHDHRHMARAVMEGVAYSLRHLLDIFEESGVPIDEIALAGGGARTRGWPQIFADVCQRPVSIYAGQETVTRVLYALCQSGLGVAPFEKSLASTFDEPVRCTHRPELADGYTVGYHAYRSLVRYAVGQASAG